MVLHSVLQIYNNKRAIILMYIKDNVLSMDLLYARHERAESWSLIKRKIPTACASA